MNSTLNKLQTISDACDNNRFSSEIDSLLTESLADKEIEYVFWNKIAAPNNIPHLQELGLLSSRTIHENNGFQQLALLTKRATTAPREVDLILTGFIAKNNRQLDQAIDIALESGSDYRMEMTINGIINSLNNGIVPIVSSGLGRLVKTLYLRNDVDAIKLNHASIKSICVAKDIRSRQHLLSEFIKNSDQPDSHDDLLATTKCLCNGLIEYAKTNDNDYDMLLGPASTIWRASFVDTVDNSDWDFKNSVTDIIVKFLHASIIRGTCTIDQAKSILGEMNYDIFHRIYLHLLIDHGTANNISSILTNSEIISCPSYKNEVATLFKRRFNDLNQQEKDMFFSWVETGPTNLDKIDPDNRTGYIEYWKTTKLSWVEEYLSNDQRSRYNEMRSRIGDDALDLADRNHHTTSRWGAVSPFEFDDLKEKTPEEIINILKTWKQNIRRSLREPTYEGLADTFSTLIRTNPIPWSNCASRLIGLPFQYLSSAFSTWRNSIENSPNVNWAEIIILAKWVVQQTSTISAENKSDSKSTIDQYLSWTQQSITDLIERACKQGVSFELYQPFLELVTAMASGDASTSIIEKKGFLQQDHISHSLNSPRGKIAHTLCEMALWVAKHDSSYNDNSSSFNGDQTPLLPIFNLISRDLSDPNDKNFAVWSAYASHAPTLWLLNHTWFTENVVSAINLEKSTEPNRSPWSYWFTFIRWQRPHRVWFKIFKKQFEVTSNFISTLSNEEKDGIIPLGDFSEHLMTLYWQGDINLDNNGLIEIFFRNATPTIRRHALTFVGGTLSRSNEKPPQNVQQRFQGLWEWYWAKYGEIDIDNSADSPHRSSLFGDWFSSGHLDPAWSLSALYTYLENDADSDHDEKVMQHLLSIFEINPNKVIACVSRLINGDANGWRMHSWDKTVKKLVALGRSSEDTAVIDSATKLREQLVRVGHLEYLKE